MTMNARNLTLRLHARHRHLCSSSRYISFINRSKHVVAARTLSTIVPNFRRLQQALFSSSSSPSSPISSKFTEAPGSSRQNIQQLHPPVQITKTTVTNSETDIAATTNPNSCSTNSDNILPYSIERNEATQLVDDLLLYTRKLMDTENDQLNNDDSESLPTATMKDHGDSASVVAAATATTYVSTTLTSPPPSNDDRLLDQTDKNSDNNSNNHHIRHVVAFSGGIDSSVVAALVHYQCGTTNNESAVAVLGLSPAVPTDQIQLAEQVATHIGIDLEQIPTTEGSDDMYIANDGRACLACKTHLYTCLSSIAQHYYSTSSISNSNNDKAHPDGNSNNRINHIIRLYNGTNADDLTDPTRLGLIAASNFYVRSPLRYTPKSSVRLVGKHLGLPNWQYAASPCLRSRLAIGVEALPKHLRRIERAETFVRQQLQLDVTHNLRVRLLSKNRAMIEVDEPILEQAQYQLKQWKQDGGFFTSAAAIRKKNRGSAGDEGDDYDDDDDYVDGLGFASVDVRAFKTGSVATL